MHGADTLAAAQRLRLRSQQLGAYHVQRCLPPFVLYVDIGLSVDGQLHHLQVAILRGNVDDGVAVARVLQQKLDRDTVTFNDKRIEGTFRISCAGNAQRLT